MRVQARSIAERVRARLCSGDEGNTIVEFALVLPILLTVVTSIFVVGIIFNNYEVLTQATGTGAQYLQLIRTSTTDPCKDTYNAITAAAPSLTPGNITLSFTLNSTGVSGNTCAGDQSDLVQGEPVKVTATYPCNFIIYGVNYAPSGCTLSASATEYEY
jgi:Flp pilus assembly protein TadG